MRMRSCFSSLALATALLTTSAHVGPAMAQKAAVLSPVTPWAVTKVDGSADEGGGYCAMARRFKQNTILTLARNESGESSVALDFQRSKLATGENMKVVLDPGAGEQRSFYIDPVSEQAFVVRLGQDHKFFDALAETGFLRIEAAGNNYTFNLADIDSGQAKISSCLEGVTSGAAVEQASSESDIQRLRSDVAGLKKENQRLSSMIASADPEAAMGSYANDVEAQNTLMREGQRPITGMSAGQPSSNQLMEENRRLQNAISAIRLGGEKAVAVHERIAKLEQKNMALVNDLNKTPVNSREWKKTQAKIFTLEEENKRLQNLLEKKSGSMAMVDSLQNQVQTLRSENSKLMQLAMNDVSPAAGGPEEVATDAAPAPAPEQLIPPAAQPPEPVPVIPTEVSDSPQQRIESLMAQLREKDAQLVELSNLKTEMESLRAKNAELEQKLLEGAKDKETITALNDRIKVLEQENETLKKSPGQGTDVEALKKENAALKKEVASLKGSLSKIREEEEVKRQNEMQRLARENMLLKQKMGVGAAPVAAVPEEVSPSAAKVADDIEEISEPVETVQDKPAQQEKTMPVHDEDPAIQEVIVSEPANQANTTEAQQQEAEMMQGMGKAAAPVAKSDEIQWNSPPLSSPPSQSQPGPEEPAPVKEVVPVTPLSPRVEAAPVFSIRDVVVSANVAENGQIQKVDNGNDQSRSVYQWRNGDVYGSSEQKNTSGDFVKEVTAYLEKTKKRCPGEFASKPDDTLENGSSRIETYEIACLGKNVDTSASILFVGNGGNFSIVAHEASSAKMEEAMALRDKVLKTLTGQ